MQNLDLIDEILVTAQALWRLSRNARLALARVAELAEFAPGQNITTLGDRCDCVYVILSGQVKMLWQVWLAAM